MIRQTLPIAFDVAHAAIKSHLRLEIIEQSDGRAVFKIPDARYLGNCGTLILRKIDDKKCMLEPDFEIPTEHETLALQQRMAMYKATNVSELDVRERFLPADDLTEKHLVNANNLPIWEQMLNLWLGIGISDLAPELQSDLQAQPDQVFMWLDSSIPDVDKIRGVIDRFTEARDQLIKERERYQQMFVDQLQDGLRRDGILLKTKINQHIAPHEVIFKGTPTQFATVVRAFDNGRGIYHVDYRDPTRKLNDVIQRWSNDKQGESSLNSELIEIPDTANVVYTSFDVLGQVSITPGTSFGSLFGNIAAQVGPEQTTILRVEFDTIYPELADLWEAFFVELRRQGWVRTPTEIAFSDDVYMQSPLRPEPINEMIFDDRLDASAEAIVKIIVGNIEGNGGVRASVIKSSPNRTHWQVSIWGPSEDENYLSPSWATVIVWDFERPTCRVRVNRLLENDLVPSGTRGALISMVWSLLSAIKGREEANAWQNKMSHKQKVKSEAMDNFSPTNIGKLPPAHEQKALLKALEKATKKKHDLTPTWKEIQAELEISDGLEPDEKRFARSHVSLREGFRAMLQNEKSLEEIRSMNLEDIVKAIATRRRDKKK